VVTIMQFTFGDERTCQDLVWVLETLTGYGSTD